MFTTCKKLETFNNIQGSINVRYTHSVDISSKNHTTEAESFTIVNQSTDLNECITLDRKQMRDLFDILLTMKDKGQI